MTTTSRPTSSLGEFTGRIPDGPFDEVDLATRVELRVHGVGGTPPTEMLDDLAPLQVSGDATAGVWRGHDPSPPAGAVEAYSWGGLTEKSWRSALWLVALPFAMVNVAGWMPARSWGPYRGVVRLAGLALTAVYVQFAAVIGMDFASYQCAAKPGCLTSGWWIVGIGGITRDGAQRAVVGAALPLAVVLGLGLLTGVSRRRYEQWELAVPSRPDAGVAGNADTPAEVGLTHERFWRGQGFAAHLAEIHLFVGMALPALLLSITASTTTDSTWAPSLTVVIVVALVVGGLAGMVTRVRDRLRGHVSLVLGAVLFVAAAVAAWTGTPTGPDGIGPLPGMLPTFGAVLCVFFGGAIVLLGIGLAMPPTEGQAGTRFRHAYTPFAVTVVAGLFGSAVLAGTALWVAGTFGQTVGVGDPAAGKAAILYPQPFEAIARSLVLTAVIAAVVGVVAAAVAARGVDETPWRRLRAALKRVDEGGRPVDRSWDAGVQRQLRVPAAARAGAEWSLWTLGGGGALAMAGYGVFWLLHARDAAARFRDLQAIPLLPPLSLSIFLLTLLPLGAIWVVRQSLRKVAVRKLVSVAWDIATFWPRSFHPLCPPCYAERAVPEIQTRLLRIWANGGAVELLGHSQGAVLVTAAVASLPPDHLPAPNGTRLTLITYGNPARRLYARHFPAYVHDGLLDEVLTRVGGPDTWTNFYRDTDPIGYRVWPPGGPAVDVYLPDPAADRFHPGDAPPQVRGHAERGYRRQTPFVARARELAGRLRT